MELRIIILSVACFSCLTPPAFGHILAAKAAAVGAGKGIAVALAAKGALALKGAAIKGAALLAKGAAIKGAALLAAKGAAIKHVAAFLAEAAAAKGAALLAAKGAAIKGLLAAKKAALIDAVDIGATAIKAGALAAAKGSALEHLLHEPEELVVVQDQPQEVHVFNHRPRWMAVAPSYYVPASPSYVNVNSFHRVPQPIPEVPPEFPSVLFERLSALREIAEESAGKQAQAAEELVSALRQAKINGFVPPP